MFPLCDGSKPLDSPRRARQGVWKAAGTYIAPTPLSTQENVECVMYKQARLTVPKYWQGNCRAWQELRKTNNQLLRNLLQQHACDKLSSICHTRVVCEYCPEKDDPNLTQMTLVGGHLCAPIHYVHPHWIT